MRRQLTIPLAVFIGSILGPSAFGQQMFRFPIDGDRTPARGFGEFSIDPTPFDPTREGQFCGFHLAVDVGGNRPGTAVYPMTLGTVKYARITPGLGYAVVVEHPLPPGDPGGPVVTAVYYHMRRPADGGILWCDPAEPQDGCQPSANVTPSQPLGYISAQPEDYGYTAPHLHFGIRTEAYKPGRDPRTEKWLYPGYTNIRQSGVLQCDPSDPRHGEILGEWTPPLVFVSARESSGPAVVAGPLTNAANRHQYYLLGSASWTDSEMAAVELGGHLVTISDQGEQDWVSATLGVYGGVNRNLWIGLRSTTTPTPASAYGWVSGEPVTYTNWASPEPNDPPELSGQERFVHMYTPDHGQYPSMWNNFAESGQGIGGGVPHGVVEVIPTGAIGGIVRFQDRELPPPPQPVAGVAVSLLNQDTGELVGQTQTTADGAYFLSAPAGTYLLHAEREYQPGSNAVLSADLVVTILADATAALDIELIFVEPQK